MRPSGRRLPGVSRRSGVRVLAVAALLLLTACAPSGISQKSRDIATFYNVVFFIALIVFVGVNGALIYFVTQYRRKPTDVDMPPQVHGSTVAEITWTVIPALIVLGLFGMSWTTIRSVDKRDTKEPGVIVNVQGYQWNWQFNYGPALTVKSPPGTATPPLMKVPINETVRFVLTSDNVIHAFSLPSLLFKRDVVPGKQNEFDVKIDTPGRYEGQCAEFCGTDHARMNFVLEAVNRQAFDQWVQEAKSQACAGEPLAELTVSSPPDQIAFDKDCLVAPANQPVQLTYTNGGGELHNVAVAKSQAEIGVILGTSGPFIDRGTQTGTIPPQPAGQYYFYCQVHPVMNGTYKVQ